MGVSRRRLLTLVVLGLVCVLGVIAWVAVSVGMMHSDVAVREAYRSPRGHMDWRPDGRCLVRATGEGLDVYAVEGMSLRYEFGFASDLEWGLVRRVAWHPSGKSLALEIRARGEEAALQPASLSERARDRLCIWLIYVVPAPGQPGAAMAVSGERTLSETSPAWSPDGSLLAFVRARPVRQRDIPPEPPGSLVLWDRGSGHLRTVVPGGVVGDVLWSPDGKRLLYGVQGPPDSQTGPLMVADLASGSSAPVARGSLEPLGTDHATWLADGRILLVARDQNGEGLFVVSLRGEAPKVVRRTPSNAGLRAPRAHFSAGNRAYYVQASYEPEDQTITREELRCHDFDHGEDIVVFAAEYAEGERSFSPCLTDITPAPLPGLTTLKQRRGYSTATWAVWTSAFTRGQIALK
jgi:hypothetical protein